MRPGAAAHAALCLHLRALGIVHEVEYPWGAQLTPPRRFRADVAVPARRLLVEVVGGAHLAGRAKLYADTERTRLAVMAGWVILPFSPPEAHDGTAALEVQRWLSSATERRVP